MIASQSIPLHIAIIMDGNGRWAHQRNSARIEGHRHGAKAVKRVVTHCRRIGIRALTLYAFSEENWGRPEDEVLGLMNLLHDYLVEERQSIIGNNIRLNTIGDIDKLPDFTRDPLIDVKDASKNNHQMILTLALSYSARDEIIRAAQKTFGQKQLTNAPMNIHFKRNLETGFIPDPDLIIRTSGEQRLSNFLLWQAAYSEFYFTSVLWPDCDEHQIDLAVQSFCKRERRFGKTSKQLFGSETC